MNAPVRFPLLQVDAFSRDPFGGNPAAVVVLESPRPAAWLQAVAAEMNLSETAFLLRREDGGFDLRWFTPAVEVTLCGHATLASAYALWSTGRAATQRAPPFETLSGTLTASPRAGRQHHARLPGAAGRARARCPVRHRRRARRRADRGARRAQGPGGTDYVVEVADEATVVNAQPDFAPLKAVDGGIVLTAPAATTGWDFVSRYFAPAFGIDEDPVTGSAHCALTPYWAERLGQPSMTARQVSRRGGTLKVTLKGDRVLLAGHAVTVLSGELVAESLASPDRSTDRKDATMDAATRKTLIAQYKAGYDEIVKALAGADDAALDLPPGPGKWTAREIVHHLADSEMTLAIRLRRLLAEDNAEIVGYDQDEFVRTLHYDRPIAASLEAFKWARVSTAEILERMSGRRLDTRRPPQRDRRLPDHPLAQIYAEHATKHAAQIRRARASAA